MGAVLGRVLGAYAPSDVRMEPIIRERGTQGTALPYADQRETPMTFSYGPGAAPDDAEQTASDPADSTRTARRDSLSEQEAAALLRRVDGEPVPPLPPVPPAAPSTSVDLIDPGDPDDAASTQELSGDDIFEAVTVLVPPEPPTLESLPEATGKLPALPPAAESTPTLPASEAPRTPAVASAPASNPPASAAPASAAPASKAPATQPPSTMPTLIAPKSMGVPSRKHTDLFEDLLRAPLPKMKQLGGSLTQLAPHITPRISHGDHPPVRPIVDLEKTPFVTPSRPSGSDAAHEPLPSTRRVLSELSEDVVTSAPSSPATSPATTVPRTRPYPFGEGRAEADVELASMAEPVTEPASLPIPLFPDAAQSRPVPLARLIEASIVSDGARPTLESAQPIAIEAPKVSGGGPSIWAHGAPPSISTSISTGGPVRPLVLPDMSGAVPVLPAFDPRIAHVDYAEGLARRQQAERAAAEKLLERPRRSRAWLVAFAAFAVLIAATLFCAAVLMLRQGPPAAAYATQPVHTAQQRSSLARNAGAAGPTATPLAGPVAAAPAAAAPAAKGVQAETPLPKTQPIEPADGNNGIPVLAVDLLPKAPNSRGVLHIGKQYDGHRVFVDGAVVGNGAGDYELVCGRHGVKIGSQDRTHPVVVPCGGDTSL